MLSAHRSQGFTRILERLPDLVLDSPTAPEVVGESTVILARRLGKLVLVDLIQVNF